MVRRTKSMDAAIEEGLDYLRRTQKLGNEIRRNDEPKPPRK